MIEFPPCPSCSAIDEISFYLDYDEDPIPVCTICGIDRNSEYIELIVDSE